MNLHNETVINVAALLKEGVGATRGYELTLDRFSLDIDLVAVAVLGDIRLTRLSDEIIASVHAEGLVTLECQRCLNPYAQSFESDFDEEFRETVDVRTGAGRDTARDDEDERFTINQNHELDIAEPLRQEILVALPMRPACGSSCPGPDVIEFGNDDAASDDRFAALARLLDDDQTS